ADGLGHAQPPVHVGLGTPLALAATLQDILLHGCPDRGRDRGASARYPTSVLLTMCWIVQQNCGTLFQPTLFPGARTPMSDTIQLYDAHGRRLYLSAAERDAFLDAATHADRPIRTLCSVLYYTGCRISEALALRPRPIDLH